MKTLVLTGFMGTGKTTVGRAVALRLGRPFVDMDALIEAQAGKPIPRIFEEDGEAAFRRWEADLCQALGERQGLVIATGGGALVDPVNRAAFSSAAVLVCLNADIETIVERLGDAVDRPMLGGKSPRADAARLLRARQTAYAAIPWQVDTTGRSLDEVVERVVALAGVQTLYVTHPGGRYPIHIGQQILCYLGGALRAAGIPVEAKIAIVSNDVVAPLYAEPVRAALQESDFSPCLCVLPDGEAHKTLETVRRLYDQFLDHDLDRSGVVLALGGGVTGDIAGFAAATFMRGLPFVQVPTSLLAMTDASVGAKTGVDLPQGKNLVGAFKQPALVFVDLSVLQTLPLEELRSGWAEVLKHGIIADPGLFAMLADALDVGDLSVTPDMLARSIRVKRDIVEADPFEQGGRAVLNLGHTTGHALERLSGYTLRHGEAVAIGMVVAARIAEVMEKADDGLAERIAHVLSAAGLPVRCPSLAVDRVWEAMRHDKKRRGRRLLWVLPRAIGDVTLEREVPDALVRSVLIQSGAKEVGNESGGG